MKNIKLLYVLFICQVVSLDIQVRIFCYRFYLIIKQMITQKKNKKMRD